MLRKLGGSDKNLFKSISNKKIYQYNVMNNTANTDYHANNIGINLKDSQIVLNKLNFYNPIINTICDGLFNRSEVYNNKFAHEALYLCNDLRFNSNYKYANKKNIQVLESLKSNIKGYNLIKHFYRCEFKFAINNKNRKYVKYNIIKLKNYILRFKRNLKFLYKINVNSNLICTDIAKKFFFKVFRKGGEQFYYLEKNIEDKIIVQKNRLLKNIFISNINIL